MRQGSPSWLTTCWSTTSVASSTGILRLPFVSQCGNFTAWDFGGAHESGDVASERQETHLEAELPPSPTGCSPDPRWDPPRVTPACRCPRRQGRRLSLRTLPARTRGYGPSCLLLALGAQQQLSNRELWATASGLAPAVSYSGSPSLCLSGVPGQSCLGQCWERLGGFLLFVFFFKKNVSFFFCASQIKFQIVSKSWREREGKALWYWQKVAMP